MNERREELTRFSFLFSYQSAVRPFATNEKLSSTMTITHQDWFLKFNLLGVFPFSHIFSATVPLRFPYKYCDTEDSPSQQKQSIDRQWLQISFSIGSTNSLRKKSSSSIVRTTDFYRPDRILRRFPTTKKSSMKIIHKFIRRKNHKNLFSVEFARKLLNVRRLWRRIFSSIRTSDLILVNIVANVFTKNLTWRNTLTFTQVSWSWWSNENVTFSRKVRQMFLLWFLSAVFGLRSRNESVRINFHQVFFFSGELKLIKDDDLLF